MRLMSVRVMRLEGDAAKAGEFSVDGHYDVPGSTPPCPVCGPHPAWASCYAEPDMDAALERVRKFFSGQDEFTWAHFHKQDKGY